jgi:hypothetical protein
MGLVTQDSCHTTSQFVQSTHSTLFWSKTEEQLVETTPRLEHYPYIKKACSQQLL